MSDALNRLRTKQAIQKVEGLLGYDISVLGALKAATPGDPVTPDFHQILLDIASSTNQLAQAVQARLAASTGRNAQPEELEFAAYLMASLAAIAQDARLAANQVPRGTRTPRRPSPVATTAPSGVATALRRLFR